MLVGEQGDTDHDEKAPIYRGNLHHFGRLVHDRNPLTEDTFCQESVRQFVCI